MSKVLEQSPKSLSQTRPVRVRLASGHSIEFPGDSTPEDRLRLSQAMQAAVRGGMPKPVEPAPATSTVADLLGQSGSPASEPAGWRRARDAGGRAIAAMLGLDFDAMKEAEKNGVMIGMVPMAPKGIVEKMLKMGIGKKVTAETVKPRRGMFHSFIADEGGNLIDLEDLTHDVAIARAQGRNHAADPLGAVASGFDDADDTVHALNLQKELKDNKLIRLQVQPSSISVEMHHAPTPHQVDALEELIEKNPKAKISYDLFADEANEFKNGVTGEDFLKRLNEFYYSGKTNRALLRDIVDKKLGSQKFFGEGEFVP